MVLVLEPTASSTADRHSRDCKKHVDLKLLEDYNDTAELELNGYHLIIYQLLKLE